MTINGRPVQGASLSELLDAQTSVLVDLGYILNRLVDLSKILNIEDLEFDIARFVSTFGRFGLAHTFIYYAFASGGESETISRTYEFGLIPVQNLEEQCFLEVISQIPNCVARLGEVSSGRKRTQKCVDVLLTVDMLKKMYSGSCKKFVLVTGDQDYLPAINVCIENGVVVEVIGFKRTMNRALRYESSSCQILDDYALLQYVRPRISIYYSDSPDGLSNLSHVKDIEVGDVRIPIFRDNAGEFRTSKNNVGYFGSDNIQILESWLVSDSHD